MATKREKRLAGERRAAEVDAAHQAEIAERKRVADARARRRANREVEQQRRVQTIKAMRVMRPTLENGP